MNNNAVVAADRLMAPNLRCGQSTRIWASEALLHRVPRPSNKCLSRLNPAAQESSKSGRKWPVDHLGLSQSGPRATLCLRPRRPTISPPRASGPRMKMGPLHGLPLPVLLTVFVLALLLLGPRNIR